MTQPTPEYNLNKLHIRVGNSLYGFAGVRISRREYTSVEHDSRGVSNDTCHELTLSPPFILRSAFHHWVKDNETHPRAIHFKSKI